MANLIFTLNITSQEYQRYYQGIGKIVVAKTDDGRQLQFPAQHLRQFVSHTGIQGRFRIDFDSSNKFVNLRRL